MLPVSWDTHKQNHFNFRDTALFTPLTEKKHLSAPKKELSIPKVPQVLLLKIIIQLNGLITSRKLSLCEHFHLNISTLLLYRLIRK